MKISEMLFLLFILENTDVTHLLTATSLHCHLWQGKDNWETRDNKEPIKSYLYLRKSVLI